MHAGWVGEYPAQGDFSFYSFVLTNFFGWTETNWFPACLSFRMHLSKCNRPDAGVRTKVNTLGSAGWKQE